MINWPFAGDPHGFLVQARFTGGALTGDKKDETFRVIDRRLFNEDGELRTGVRERELAERAAPKAEKPSSAATAAPDPPAASAAESKPAPPPAAEAPRPSRSFQLLVDLLAQNAALFLGAYPDPTSGRAIVDLDRARDFIDMIEMLREKTRGNLAPDDDRVLVEVLSSLKMSFLEISKAAAQAVRENPTAIPQAKFRGKP